MIKDSKVVRLNNQLGDKPSWLIRGGKLVMVGNIQHMDEITFETKTDMMRLADWLQKEINRKLYKHSTTGRGEL